MEEGFTNGQLGKMIKDGFEGVHKRQDLTNGKVDKNTSFRNQAKGAIAVVGVLGVSSFVGIILMWLKLFS